MSYNKFTREIMCWSLNTYPFGCCSLPMQRDWKEYVSIKNDIKVVVIDKETGSKLWSSIRRRTRWRALAACSAVIASLFLTLDDDECIDPREVL